MEPAIKADSKRGLPKYREGIVVSNKMEKTIVVAVSRQKAHGAYGKYIRRTKHYMAHDQNNDCRPGDRVLIQETRPLSKCKRWRVRKVIERAA